MAANSAPPRTASTAPTVVASAGNDFVVLPAGPDVPLAKCPVLGGFVDLSRGHVLPGLFVPTQSASPDSEASHELRSPLPYAVRDEPLVQVSTTTCIDSKSDATVDVVNVSGHISLSFLSGLLSLGAGVSFEHADNRLTDTVVVRFTAVMSSESRQLHRTMASNDPVTVAVLNAARAAGATHMVVGVILGRHTSVRLQFDRRASTKRNAIGFDGSGKISLVIARAKVGAGVSFARETSTLRGFIDACVTTSLVGVPPFTRSLDAFNAVDFREEQQSSTALEALLVSVDDYVRAQSDALLQDAALARGVEPASGSMTLLGYVLAPVESEITAAPSSTESDGNPESLAANLPDQIANRFVARAGLCWQQLNRNAVAAKSIAATLGTFCPSTELLCHVRNQVSGTDAELRSLVKGLATARRSFEETAATGASLRERWQALLNFLDQQFVNASARTDRLELLAHETSHFMRTLEAFKYSDGSPAACAVGGVRVLGGRAAVETALLWHATRAHGNEVPLVVGLVNVRALAADTDPSNAQALARAHIATPGVLATRTCNEVIAEGQARRPGGAEGCSEPTGVFLVDAPALNGEGEEGHAQVHDRDNESVDSGDVSSILRSAGTAAVFAGSRRGAAPYASLLPVQRYLSGIQVFLTPPAAAADRSCNLAAGLSSPPQGALRVLRKVMRKKLASSAAALLPEACDSIGNPCVVELASGTPATPVQLGRLSAAWPLVWLVPEYTVDAAASAFRVDIEMEEVLAAASSSPALTNPRATEASFPMWRDSSTGAKQLRWLRILTPSRRQGGGHGHGAAQLSAVVNVSVVAVPSLLPLGAGVNGVETGPGPTWLLFLGVNRVAELVYLRVDATGS